MACALCDPELGPVIQESGQWRLMLNRNQDLLGKCFLALRRHVEAVPELTTEEWRELHEQMAIATEALQRELAPDHFNYAFLQNQDRHVHLHIVPRYAGVRTFAGEVFDDPGYPGHYRVGGPARRVSPEVERRLAERLRHAIAGDAGH